MRRKDRLIESKEQVEAILREEEVGYLATCGTDALPMATPVNYVYFDDRIFFHCALTGRKLDNIKQNPKVGFTVVRDVEIDRINMTTYYSSIMVEGIAGVVEDPETKMAAIEEITRRLAAPGEECNDKSGIRTAIVAIEITSMVGKRNRPK